jgi:hypothetical protein
LNSSRAAPKVGISASLQQAAGNSNLKDRHLRNLQSFLLPVAKTVQKDIIFFNCIYINELWNRQRKYEQNL